MASDELTVIVDQLNKQEKMAFLKRATEDQIVLFEKIHEIKLPEKFKEWLQYSDGGDCFLPAGVQFYGITHEPLINVDCSDRPDDSYVVIGSLDTGDPILFKKGSEQISIQNQEAVQIEDDEIYDDFFAFLFDLCNLLGIEG